jgi:hypothetical protein
MNRIDTEFAFQARELAAQIEDTLGDPPDRKYYRRVVDALLQAYGKETFIEDVNLLSFALVDHLQFQNPQALLAAAAQYQSGDLEHILPLVSSTNSLCTKVLDTLTPSHSALLRQAILVAFLHKNRVLWVQEEVPSETVESAEGDADDEEENNIPIAEVIELFDPTGDEHGG